MNNSITKALSTTQQLNTLIAHPSIAPFIQASIVGYEENQILEGFCTGFISHPDYWLSNLFLKVLPRLKPEINRRFFAAIPVDKIHFYPWRELLRTLLARYADPMLTDFIWEWSEHSFDRFVAQKLSPRHHCVHTYEHSALATLKRAKQLGVLSIYEQPSQHHAFFTQIVEEQFIRYPELKQGALNLLNNEKAQRRNQRRDEELLTADWVRCNSSFTKKTLSGAGVPDAKISVIPYGFPTVEEPVQKTSKSKVIFLNAGNQNLRKALHLLYLAWRECKFSESEAELWLIGKMALPESLRQGLPGKVVIRENIPREELMQLYHQVDVFVLPTLADGFGMVISEAMSRGVPVITTENSGGPDIITHQKDGFIIPAGEVAPLVQQMKWCVQNKHLLPQMGYAAQQKAGSWQWKDFSQAVAQFVIDQVEQAQADGSSKR